jgi:hypothetical protein
MENTESTDKLDVDNWDIKAEDRSRNRMKLKIKLSADEAQSYKNYRDVIKPEDVSDDQFIKAVFLTGLEALQFRILEELKSKAESEGLSSSGVDVPEANLESAEVSAPGDIEVIE